MKARGVRKQFGRTVILHGIDLTVDDGQIVVLVGPSGCGKSTLLRTIAGLESIDDGSIHIGDRDVTRLPPKDRDVAMVFQSYALYPHLTVRDNLAFGLELRGAKASLIEERVSEVSRMLGLEELLHRLPRQLSGGQRQRVAMGRAIARRPKLFLFDEPLSNLDASLRSEVRVEIKRLHQKLGATMIYVTHDQVEAMTLADRLVVLRKGNVEQIGSPLDVYERPASRFVASFVGSPSMNFMPATAQNGKVEAKDLSVVMGDGQKASGKVLAGIRPQDVTLVPRDEADLHLKVEVLEAMGFEAYVHGHVGDEPFVARIEGANIGEVAVGAELGLKVAEGSLHLFDPETERALEA